MQNLDWDDLRLFAAVARAGGLSAAAAETAASPATLGRRMTALERTLGARLFVRRRDGYELTEAGRELRSRCAPAEDAVLSVQRWAAASISPPAVRVACGAWTGAFLAAHAAALAATAPRLALDILTGAGLVDLLRREADLGIRNRRPTTLGLAGRRLGPVAFAVYGAPALLRDTPSAGDERRFREVDWVAFEPGGTAVPSTAWLDRHLRRRPQMRCTDARTIVDAAAAGIGLCVLPCFVGDADGRLARASDTIPDLMHEQWLVSHDEDRHSRAIRVAADRIAKLFRGRRRLFAGQDTPTGGRSSV